MYLQSPVGCWMIGSDALEPAALDYTVHHTDSTTARAANTLIQDVTLQSGDRYTMVSCPIGTMICSPNRLVMPINKSVGMMICIGCTAARYASPERIRITSSANIMKNTIKGIAKKKTIRIALTTTR